MGFSPGEHIAGRYVVESVIASGGMGVIYAARHLVLDEPVAIKCLLPELSSDAEQAARLIGEARAAAKIRSEHVARISDADRLPDGTVFLAMERLDGRDLGAILEEQRTVPVETAIAYVLQAGEALAEAHACGIVHRDLKPANLFAARRPDGSTCIKVLDFGISKVLPHEAQVRTRTGTFMGTPMYASPEQLTTPSDVDLRTDIWAVGCVLYELLTGEPPFVRDTIGALVSAIVAAPVAAISTKRGDVPAALEAAIARCLAKERDQRWNGIGDLAVALGPFSPAQAAISVPRIQALAVPSAATVAAVLPVSGSGLAFAPTISVAPAASSSASSSASAPVSKALTPAPASGSRGTVAWIAACVLGAALLGGLVVRKKRATPIAPDAETAAAVEASAAPPSDAGTTTAALTTSAPAPTPAPPEGVASSSQRGGSRAATPARAGTRHANAPPSPSGKSDDWNMHLKE